MRNFLFLFLGIFSIFLFTTEGYTAKKKYNVELTWYGHSAATLYDGKTRILIDPFFTGNSQAPIPWTKLPRIDYILITHDHFDHTGDVIDIAKAQKAKVIGVYETMQALVKRGLPQDLVLNGIGSNIGGTLKLGGFKVLMVPAVHSSETGVPAGYIITSSTNFKTYHAGDTAPFGDMKLWASWFPVNLALIPVGGYFTEGAQLAVNSLKLLRPDYVLPIHYRTFPILAQNLDEFNKYLKKANLKTKLLTLLPGQSRTF